MQVDNTVIVFLEGGVEFLRGALLMLERGAHKNSELHLRILTAHNRAQEALRFAKLQAAQAEPGKLLQLPQPDGGGVPS